MVAVDSAIKKAGGENTLTKEHFDQVETFYKHCQKAVRSGTVSNACLNIRGFVRALKTVALSCGYSTLKEWIRLSVINTCPFDERQALYSYLDAVVTL